MGVGGAEGAAPSGAETGNRDAMWGRPRSPLSAPGLYDKPGTLREGLRGQIPPSCPQKAWGMTNACRVPHDPKLIPAAPKPRAQAQAGCQMGTSNQDAPATEFGLRWDAQGWPRPTPPAGATQDQEASGPKPL